MIDLYTFGTSNGLRASIMLEECEAIYTPHKVDILKGEQKNPEFLKINPMGAIPAIVDRDGPGGKTLVLSQSAAILLYLAGKYDKYVPKDPMRRALVDQWTMSAATDIGPQFGVCFQLSMREERTPAITQLVESRMSGMLKALNARLAGERFLAGDYSIADIAMYPVWFRTKQRLAHLTGGLDHVDRWAGEIGARPGVQRGLKVPA